ncbi:MAG TPA: shikimate dehydrogenase [Thermoplasmata archaeon]
MTKVVAVITASTPGEAERQARTAIQRGADLVEFRVDRLRDLNSADIRKLAGSFGPRAIATLRSPSEGGGRPRSGLPRIAVLRELCQPGFGYVDLELEADAKDIRDLRVLAKRHRSRVIVSRHFEDFVGASKIRDTLEASAAVGDIAKAVVPIAHWYEALEVVDLARSWAAKSKPYVLIGMGPAGAVTRVLAGDLGQAFHYAAFGAEAAPGQLPLRSAIRVHGPEPFVVGLVGHRIGHSISPQIHEAALDAAGLPGVYLPFDVEASDLEPLLQSADRLRLRGLNITIPHKERIASMLDELDGDAERLGAVNTVVVDGGWAKGFNTDVYGFRISLRALGLRLGERDALVVGAGGAAKAVVHVLLREGARVQVANRSASRAEALADSFDEPLDVVSLDELPTRGPWDLLVNATPAGMEGHDATPPVPESVIRKAAFVYDLVYNPPSTLLLQVAARLGKPATSGIEMLLHQAAKAFELWTDRPASIDAMRRAAKEALR